MQGEREWKPLPSGKGVRVRRHFATEIRSRSATVDPTPALPAPATVGDASLAASLIRPASPGVIRGERWPDGEAVVTLDGRRLDWERSLHVAAHSPSGVEWSFAGSGPAQLALAILLEVSGDETTAVDHLPRLPHRPGPRVPHSHLPVDDAIGLKCRSLAAGATPHRAHRAGRPAPRPHHIRPARSAPAGYEPR